MNKDNIGEYFNAFFAIMQNERCPICLDVIRTVVELSCMHRYCNDCYLTFKLNTSTPQCPICKESTNQIQGDTDRVTDEEVETLVSNQKVATIDKSTEQFNILFGKLLDSQFIEEFDRTSTSNRTKCLEDLECGSKPSTSTVRRHSFSGDLNKENYDFLKHTVINEINLIEEKAIDEFEQDQLIQDSSSSDSEYNMFKRGKHVKRAKRDEEKTRAFNPVNIYVQPSTSRGIPTKCNSKSVFLSSEEDDDIYSLPTQRTIIKVPPVEQGIAENVIYPQSPQLMEKSAEQLLIALHNDLNTCEIDETFFKKNFATMVSNITTLKKLLINNNQKFKCDAETQANDFEKVHQMVQTEPDINTVSTQTANRTVDATCQTEIKPNIIDIACQCSVNQVEASNQTENYLNVEQAVQATICHHSIEVQTETDCVNVAVQTLDEFTASTSKKIQEENLFGGDFDENFDFETQDFIDGNLKKSTTEVVDTTEKLIDDLEGSARKRFKRIRSPSSSPDEAATSKIKRISANYGDVDLDNMECDAYLKRIVKNFDTSIKEQRASTSATKKSSQDLFAECDNLLLNANKPIIIENSPKNIENVFKSPFSLDDQDLNKIEELEKIVNNPSNGTCELDDGFTAPRLSEVAEVKDYSIVSDIEIDELMENMEIPNPTKKICILSDLPVKSRHISEPPAEIQTEVSSETLSQALFDTEAIIIKPPNMFEDSSSDSDELTLFPAEILPKYPPKPSKLYIESQESQLLFPSISVSPIPHQVDLQVQQPSSSITQVTQIGLPNFTSTPKENGCIKPAKPICISHSRLTVEQVQMIKKLCSSKNFGYSEHLESTVTHLVVVAKENHCIHDYTLKYVTAVASGIWILRYEWIVDSIRDHDLKPEAFYEALDVCGADGPKRSRMTRVTKPLFKNFIFYCGTFVNSKRENIEDIVQQLGGRVISSPKSFNNFNNRNIRLIVSEISNTEDFYNYNEWLELYKVITVDLDWLVHSIGRYALQNVRKYMMCDEVPILHLGYPNELVEPVPFTQSNPEC